MPDINDWDFQRKVMWEIGTAVLFLHKHGICHNDVTTNNVMFDTKNNCALLIDFGNATICDNLFPITSNNLLPMCAKLPEDESYIVMNQSTDAWCFMTFCLSLATKGASDLIMSSAHLLRTSSDLSTLSSASSLSDESKGSSTYGSPTKSYIHNIKLELRRIGFNNKALYPTDFHDLIYTSIKDRLMINNMLQMNFFNNRELLPINLTYDMTSSNICTVSNRMDIMYYAVNGLYHKNIATCFHLIDLLDRYYLHKYTTNVLPDFIYKQDIAVVLQVLNDYYPIKLEKYKLPIVYKFHKYLLDNNIPIWKPTIYDYLSNTLDDIQLSKITTISIIDDALIDLIAGKYTNVSLNKLIDIYCNANTNSVTTNLNIKNEEVNCRV
jgi:serine/threonine protein kinase